MDKTLQEALSQLRALEAAGEDPRNANQRWDVTPEQAGALLAHLDDVEQKRVEAGDAVLPRARAEFLAFAGGNAPDAWWQMWEEATRLAEQRHAAAVSGLRALQFVLASSDGGQFPLISARTIVEHALRDAAPAQEASDGK